MVVKVQVHKGQQANLQDDGEMNPEPALLPARNDQQTGLSAVDNTTDGSMQQLAAAADQCNESMFLAAKQQIDWRWRPAADFTHCACSCAAFRTSVICIACR